MKTENHCVSRRRYPLNPPAVAVALCCVLMACTQEPKQRAELPLAYEDADVVAHTVKNQGPTQHTAPVAVLAEAVSQHAPQLAAENRALTAKVAPAMLVMQDSMIPIQHPGHELSPGDNYAGVDTNPVTLTAHNPVSTFGLDVDTGSYAVVRRHITHGQLPPTAAVRPEELINYFDYATPHATGSEHPFKLSTELAVAPWHPERYVLRIGVDAAREDRNTLPPANLVFLIDVSGSMNAPDKLPLLKSAMRLLTRTLDGEDRVTIVTYAGQSAVALEPTPGNQTTAINAAITALGAGGSTHGAAGLREAYRLAQSVFIEGGINRVMLATDGDFNVGETDHSALVKLIESKRASGIALSTLGFGQGNYNDHLMEQLADHGNGNYAYIDTLREARKVLDQQLGATLLTVAHDTKIQVEFNPATVAEYRLIGYENRALREQDFNNDRIDAGEIGAGHTVTALYEVALVGSAGTQIPPRTFSSTASTEDADLDALAEVRLRYKRSAGAASERLDRIVEIKDATNQPSENLRFSASVAAWSDWLRDGEFTSAFGPDAITELASSALGTDAGGYRREFLDLVALSQALKG